MCVFPLFPPSFFQNCSDRLVSVADVSPLPLPSATCTSSPPSLHTLSPCSDILCPPLVGLVDEAVDGATLQRRNGRQRDGRLAHDGLAGSQGDPRRSEQGKRRCFEDSDEADVFGLGWAQLEHRKDDAGREDSVVQPQYVAFLPPSPKYANSLTT